MRSAEKLEVAVADLSSHPAAAAWRRCRPEAELPAVITALKPQLARHDKSGVYRLHSVGEGGSHVVAKRCHLGSGCLERKVYEQLLPSLPLPTLRYYGAIAEPDEQRMWFFIEDAGDDEPSPDADEHIARWLGRLHAEAARKSLTWLPECGPDYYRQRLDLGRTYIQEGLRNAALVEDDRGVLNRLLTAMATLDSRWPGVETLCASTPRTIVHGDFRPKNVRVRRNGNDVHVYALDWEVAGWACPAADVAELVSPAFTSEPRRVLDAYLAASLGLWGGISIEQLGRLVNVGRQFRVAASISWAGKGLKYQWLERSMRKLRVYLDQLNDTLHDSDSRGACVWL